MSPEKLLIGVIFVAVLCLSGLIAQCSHNISECRKEAIKNNVKPENIPHICRA